MIASEIVAQRTQPNADHHPPLAAIIPMRRPVARAMSAEKWQLAAIADCSLSSCHSGAWDVILSSAVTDLHRSYRGCPLAKSIDLEGGKPCK
jgi:hypothetical protein